MSTEQEQRQNGMTEGDKVEPQALEETNKPILEGSSPERPPEVMKAAEAEIPIEPLDQGSAPVPVQEEEIPPAPALPDIRIVLNDDTEVFQENAEPRMMTRVSVVKGLIQKHASFMETYRIELETGVAVDPAVLTAMEEARGKRDGLNSEVAKLKERRTALKEENKLLRKQFLEMLKVQGRVKENAKEIEGIKEFIDRQDYKLMTEGVNLEAERKLMKDIKDSINSIKALTGGFDPKEVNEELRSLDARMDENFKTIEEHHKNMLGIVAESQVHHQRFVDESKKVREADARKGWLQRRIALHNEMLKFWETQTSNAEAMDAADIGRRAVQIKDRLLHEIEEAIREEEKARRPRKEDAPEATGEAEPPAEVSPSPPDGAGPEGPKTAEDPIQAMPGSDDSVPKEGPV
jgi:uncharacterized coiled-coil DUF342 family protein